MPEPTLQCVVFDVGGVLFNDAIAEKCRDLSHKYQIDPARLKAEVSRLRPSVDRGQLSETQFWIALLDSCGVQTEPADTALDDYLEPDETVVDIVRACRSRGLRTARLSNDSVALARRRQERCGARELFDVIVISAEHGVTKPDPVIYQILIGQLAVEPERCLLIDDLPENIATARQLRIHGHLFTTATALRACLRL